MFVTSFVLYSQL